jgi:hypothetical protein
MTEPTPDDSDLYPKEDEPGRHALPDGVIAVDTSEPAPEPVALNAGLTTLLTALVATGWVTIDSAVLNVIFTVIGLIGAVISTLHARGNVVAFRKPS